jgi:GlpG protein
VTVGLIVICVVVAILTNLGGQFGDREDGPAAGLMDKMLLVPNSVRQEFLATIGNVEVLLEQASNESDFNRRLRWGALDAVRSGEVWRLITPIFLHFSPWHLLFNMSLFYSIGGQIEGRRGELRFASLVLASAALSNFGQFYVPSLMNPLRAYVPFGGMSGVVYALFGYVWTKSKYEPTAELYIHQNTVVLMLAWLVACSLGFIDGVANWAHGVGLAVGMAIGIAPHAWRKSKKSLKRG